MRAINTILAIIKGKAIVLIQCDERKADVLIGRDVSKKFAISSMVGAVKALM
ncbi:hypothetical protein CE91St46_14190 [Eubacteriales bacterium]|nr:hypothetical protein CE91St46_14190 [Eubacteriales bacterium]GKH62945.1 hypothetical protein CE91St47_14140 [Eubacteriales bacterium]